MKYDYLIVGSGLYGATFAEQASRNGKSCLVIDKRSHIGGNCYTDKLNNIDIHKYGPHIFHTNSKKIWDYVNQFTSFNNYINRPKVKFDQNIYSFPINLFTLHQLWGVTTPNEAKTKLDSVKIHNDSPSNLEEWILSQVGEEIYYKFIYGYTKKQWGTEPRNLPKFIIQRLPIRLSYDDNYYYDRYQGIPLDGYTSMIKNMLGETDIELGVDFLSKKSYYENLAKTIVYTGPIDRFYDYTFGQLQYRSLRFEIEKLNDSDFQGNAIVNYTQEQIPWTRIIEHKHFNLNSEQNSDVTYITKEYPVSDNNEPYYPINDKTNNTIYDKYKSLTKNNNKYIFGGRLAEYRYFDMHQVIGSALTQYERHTSG